MNRLCNNKKEIYCFHYHDLIYGSFGEQNRSNGHRECTHTFLRYSGYRCVIIAENLSNIIKSESCYKKEITYYLKDGMILEMLYLLKPNLQNLPSRLNLRMR